MIPADLDPAASDRIRRMAIDAFKAIDGAGLARVDFLIEKETGAVFLNEVNTLPGFTADSMYPKLWEATGRSSFPHCWTVLSNSHSNAMRTGASTMAKRRHHNRIISILLVRGCGRVCDAHSCGWYVPASSGALLIVCSVWLGALRRSDIFTLRGAACRCGRHSGAYSRRRTHVRSGRRTVDLVCRYRRGIRSCATKPIRTRCRTRLILPNKVEVLVAERKPEVRWMHNGVVFAVTWDGIVVDREKDVPAAPPARPRLRQTMHCRWRGRLLRTHPPKKRHPPKCRWKKPLRLRARPWTRHLPEAAVERSSAT